MKTIIKEDYKGLSREAALLVKERLLAKPNLVLGLATGSTPLGLYQELIKMHQEDNLDFSQITTFNLDEYLGLPPSHPQSYHYYMWQNFFSHINIKKENVFILDGVSLDPQAHCQWYEQKVKEKGGIDLQVLGIGRNAHLGFNEPASPFNSRTRGVSLAQTTREANARFFESIEQVPKKALTMGLTTIMEARECLLLASGSQKKEAIRKALKGPITEQVPASILQKHSNLIVILDKKAAGI